MKALLIYSKELGSSIYVPDTALIEFELVLRARNISSEDIKKALYAVHLILSGYGVRYIKTIDLELLAIHLELMEEYGLTYFDSLIAASALRIDGIISDDRDFDKVEGLNRIPIVRQGI